MLPTVPSPTQRLLWLTQNYYPNRGGMAESCDRIVCHLRDRGVTVDLLHLSRRHRGFEVQQKANGLQIACPLEHDIGHSLNRAWNLLSSDAVPTPSHVVAFGGQIPLAAGPVFAAWLKRPLLTLLRGNDFDTAVFSPKRRDILRDAVTGSQCVAVVSREMGTRVQAMFPGPQVCWVGNGIDLTNWAPLPSDRGRADSWRTGNVTDDRRTIGLFGHLKQKKGVLFFLNCLKRTEMLSQFHIILVGETEDIVEEWLAAHSELVVTRLPFLERYELMTWYLACDWVVVPSFYDGFPNVLLEAGALGIPLLASTAGGMSDLLDAETALLFHPGDEHGCCQAIVRAAHEEVAERQARAARCQARIEAEFTADAECDRYCELLNTTEPLTA